MAAQINKIIGVKCHSVNRKLKLEQRCLFGGRLRINLKNKEMLFGLSDVIKSSCLGFLIVFYERKFFRSELNN